ncbi:MAG: hypothetical protein PHN88_12820 [Ignavibacteria bacterium]|nr:hypothetical protein [Ignavibacteria bacterium]
MKTVNKIMVIVGCMCLIATCVLAITYMGFYDRPDIEIKVVLIPDALTLWLVNAGFGLIGGILINYKKFLASMVAGVFTAMVITGITLLYVSWRTSIINYELLIPLFIGAISGGAVFNLLDKLIYPNEEAASLSKVKIKSHEISNTK